MTTDSATDESATISFSIVNAGTAGNVTLRWAQGTALIATNTIVHDGSYLTAFKVRGADLAEVYYTSDGQVSAGDIVSIAGSGVSQVKKSDTPYDQNAIGIISTKPGQVLGEADGFGKPVIVGLKGRVPVKVTEENGAIKAGDYITSSSEAGYGMRASTSGRVIGRALTDYDGSGTVMVFIENGYWQAPLTIDLASIFGNQATANLTATADELALNQVLGTQFNSLDQTAIDEILRGFTIQQGQLTDLESRIQAIENDNAGISSANFADLVALGDNGTLTFIGDIVFQNQVKFDSNVVFSSNSAGTVTIPAGQTEIDIVFNPEKPIIPIVIVAPNSLVEGSWAQGSISKNGFKITLAQAQVVDVQFSWQSTLVSD